MSQEAAEDYRTSLDELADISKVKINALTMLAEDNSEFAVVIAGCIENQLKNVAKSRKLPILYLIDSICKNFPESKYVELFTQNIVSNFCNVFQVSDEKVRKSLHKLRMTWNETKTFPQNKLNAIDERVHAMDPNWPILNPQETRTTIISQKKMNNPPDERVRATNQKTKHSDHLPQRGQKKLKTQTPAMTNAPVVVQPTIHLDPNIIDLAPQPPPIQQGTTITPNVPAPIYVNPAPMILSEPHPPSMITADQQQQLQHHQQQHHHHHQQQLQQQQQQQQHQQQLQQIPLATTILETLYGGKQCSNCSLRFEENGKYANHLDWHFRQNKCDKYPRRQWYYPLELWVQFRDINDEVQQENDEVAFTPIDDGEIPTATASKEDCLNICPVCQETFEKFWAEEEEEWRLRNAKLHDERVFHPLCLKDLLAR